MHASQLRPSIISDLARFKETRDLQFYNRALSDLADQVFDMMEDASRPEGEPLDGEVIALFYHLLFIGPRPH